MARRAAPPLALPPMHERPDLYRAVAARLVEGVPGAKIGPWANAHQMNDEGAFVDVSVWVPATAIALPQAPRAPRRARAKPKAKALRVIPGGRKNGNGHRRKK